MWPTDGLEIRGTARHATAPALLLAAFMVFACPTAADAQFLRGEGFAPRLPFGRAAPMGGFGGRGYGFPGFGLPGPGFRPPLRYPPVVVDEPDDERFDDAPARPRKSRVKRVTKTAVTAPPAKRAAIRASQPPRPLPRVADEPEIVPGEVLLTLKPGTPVTAVAAIDRANRLVLRSTETFTLVPKTLYRLQIRGRRSVAEVIRMLAADPRVASAEPNHAYTLTAALPPALAAADYAPAKMRLAEAHKVATGASIAVAVIDSQVDLQHPVLGGAVPDSYDALADNPGKAPHPHGTAVAGIIGGRQPLDSAAPASRLMAIRAFTGDEAGKPGADGSTVSVLRGIDWAAAHGARVVNMSFAGPQDAEVSEFIAAGTAKGAVYVAAAGNGGRAAKPRYPGADANVVAVTATDEDDRVFSGANRGRYICVAAPGVEILVATPGGGFGFSSGTSMAAAEVSGIVALMLQVNPMLTPAQARDALVRSAADRGARGRDDDFGAGLVDAQAAVGAVSAPAPAAADSSRSQVALTPVDPAPVPTAEHP